MPAATTTNPPRRKGPSFNPPRPVKAAAQASASAKRAPATTASRATGATKKAANSRPAFRAAATIISSDEEHEDEEEDARADSDLDELMDDASEPDDRPQRRPTEPSVPPIPAPLLTRLLHEHFEDEKTQIQKGAMDLYGSYITIFVREAIARAKEERGKAAKRGDGQDHILQVEDLERLTPQLVLDF